MSTELFEEFRKRINIARKYPSKTVMAYIHLAELGLYHYVYYYMYRLVGYKIPMLDHDYEKFFRIKKGDVVVDVGAHVGLFAYSVAKRAKMVVAIECEPKNLEQLHSNLRNFRNVLVVGKALWNCKGRLPLYVGAWSGGHSLIRDPTSAPWNREIMVDADTLDNVLRDLRIAEVDFVKMDIEGAEIEALEGASETLKKISRIVVASYHERNGVKTIHKVIRKLIDNGFKVYTTVDDLVYGIKKQN
jgi:FkbM family methyltransferase